MEQASAEDFCTVGGLYNFLIILPLGTYEYRNFEFLDIDTNNK